jgi:class 3 adenylate cyclase
MEPSREIRDIMLGFYHDWSRGDSDEAARLFSASPHVVGIGSDPGEWVEGGREAVALMRAQIEEITVTLTPGRLRCFTEGNVGWVVDDPVIVWGDVSTNFRVTCILHREANEWKIVHFHASIGIANEEAIGVELPGPIEAVAKIVEAERPDLRPVASPEGTLTIMFTDIEASTATNEAMGDDLFLPLLLKHNEIISTQTASAGGTVVKSQGDGFMLAFPSARRAVDCASYIQREVAGMREDIKVRMGLHTGEPLRHADDFYGRDVAYAARLGAAAVGGEILVSALVKSLVESSGSVKFDGPRELELKGFDGPQPVFAVVWR